MEFLCDVMFVNFGGGGVGDGFNIAELLTDVNKVVLLTIVEFLFLFQVFLLLGTTVCRCLSFSYSGHRCI